MKGKLLAVAILAVVLIAGCAGKKDEPAAGQPAQQQSQTPAPQSPGASDMADGKYTVVAQESEASYTVKERFAGQELDATAIGKTSAFTGDLVFANGAIKPSKVTVDVSTLKSDKGQRDNALKSRGLESGKYPLAELSITGVQGSAEPVRQGQESAFKLEGKLKVHGVEKDVVWDAKGKLEGDQVIVTAQLKFAMSDFNITPPSVLGMLTVDDKVQLDVRVVAKKG